MQGEKEALGIIQVYEFHVVFWERLERRKVCRTLIMV